MDYLSLIDEITLKEESGMSDNYLVLIDEMSLEEEYKELLHISRVNVLNEGVLSVIASLLSYIKEKICGLLEKLAGIFMSKSNPSSSSSSSTSNSNSSTSKSSSSSSNSNSSSSKSSKKEEYNLYPVTCFIDMKDLLQSVNSDLDYAWSDSKNNLEGIKKLFKELKTNKSVDTFYKSSDSGKETTDNIKFDSFNKKNDKFLEKTNKEQVQIKNTLERCKTKKYTYTIDELNKYNKDLFKVFNLNYEAIYGKDFEKCFLLKMGTSPAEVIGLKTKDKYNKIAKEIKEFSDQLKTFAKQIDKKVNTDNEITNSNDITKLCKIIIDLSKYYISTTTNFLKVDNKLSTMFYSVIDIL